MLSLRILVLLQLSTASTLPQISIDKRGHRRDVLTQSLIHERRDTIETNIVDIVNWIGGGAYFANISVGTPPQPQTVLVDTGSSDMYFNAPNATACRYDGPNDCVGGTFSRQASSSYKEIKPSPAFYARYGDGSTAMGPFGMDSVAMGDVELTNVQFGVAEYVRSTTGHAMGLIGTGYAIGEAGVLNGYSSEAYPNIPEVMVASGAINSRLYSVYLNDQDAWSGTILFGGIDTTKYTGLLVTMDLIPEPYFDTITRFITVATGMSAAAGGTNTQLFSNGTPGYDTYEVRDSLAVLLDTGSSAWSVPESFFDQYIAPTFSYIDNQNMCSCRHRDSSDTLSLEFNGQISIQVPAREFIIPYINSTTREPVKYRDGSDACLFAVVPMVDDDLGFMTLGDSILRSMYVVYDLDNGQVSIAQAAVNSSTPPNIVTVQAGPSGVVKAAKDVVTASSDTWTIEPPQPTGTRTFTVKPLASTIGTATGTNAIPVDAQTVHTAGAASSNRVPEVRWQILWAMCIALSMGILGMGLIL